MLAGQVRDGRVETDGDLPEGAWVTIVIGEVEASFTATAAEEAELLLALAEEERGELVESSAVLAAIRG